MTMRHLYKYVLVGVACLLIGAAGTALAMHTGGGEVRLVAQRHEDGRVEIGLQEREVGGGWGERQLPDARFLSAGATVGQWRASSPLDVGAGHLADGALACIIGHGQSDDIFWSMVGQGVETASEDLKMNLRFSIAPTPDQQAALVRECVSDDAQLIATTLAAPETLAPAIAEALAAGVQVATFNSGTESAPASGSAMHIGLDDQLGGKRAGEAFNASGVSGTVLCVIHEAANVGLEERCDYLESSYLGEVERLRIGDAGASSSAGAQAAIAGRLAEGDVAGVLTLGSAMLEPALAARGDSDIAVATFGWSPAAISKILSGEVLFMIYDQPHAQAYLTTAALGMMGLMGQIGNSNLIFGGVRILLEPVVFDRDRAMASAELLGALGGFASGSQDP